MRNRSPTSPASDRPRRAVSPRSESRRVGTLLEHFPRGHEDRRQGHGAGGGEVRPPGGSAYPGRGTRVVRTAPQASAHPAERRRSGPRRGIGDGRAVAPARARDAALFRAALLGALAAAGSAYHHRDHVSAPRRRTGGRQFRTPARRRRGELRTHHTRLCAYGGCPVRRCCAARCWAGVVT